MKRADDFSMRRKTVAHLSDQELAERFWQLTEQVVKPLVELAKTHTTPSIERSVLLRMGFSSIEAQQIVTHCLQNGLLGKGAGHVVCRFSRKRQIPYREGGLILAGGEGWSEVKELFTREVTR